MQFQKGYLSHLYNQGNNKQNIFFFRKNYLFFLKNAPFKSGGATQSRASTTKPLSLNKSIGILLASYTRAINKQKGSTGSLFRQKTKAECLNRPNGVAPNFFKTSVGAQISIENPIKQYPQNCFNYIHQNPVKARLVSRETDWEYSSARDYAGLRNGSLVNKAVTMQYLQDFRIVI